MIGFAWLGGHPMTLWSLAKTLKLLSTFWPACMYFNRWQWVQAGFTVHSLIQGRFSVVFNLTLPDMQVCVEWSSWQESLLFSKSLKIFWFRMCGATRVWGLFTFPLSFGPSCEKDQSHNIARTKGWKTSIIVLWGQCLRFLRLLCWPFWPFKTNLKQSEFQKLLQFEP